ncbi:hypothetical protein C0995_015032 [Termitomyces sp. Mi166|nr:hypothetical protein C0995_015032 [Termitomyces sp. Mi166\
MIKSGILVLPIRRTFSSCQAAFAGHNKWSKIKQKKGANDAQKSVIFGKAARCWPSAVYAFPFRVSRKLTASESTEGKSTDPLKNLQLAAVLKRAKDMDVPKENVEKALAKASRSKDQSGDTFIYEVLAFNSVGLIIECATDNNNRTIHTLREILNDYGARQAPVKFMFKRVGYVAVSPVDISNQNSQDELVETALTHGAIDFDNIGDSSDISEVRYIPLEDSPEVSEEAKNDLKALVDQLENHEDVLQVWTSSQDDR